MKYKGVDAYTKTICATAAHTLDSWIEKYLEEETELEHGCYGDPIKIPNVLDIKFNMHVDKICARPSAMLFAGETSSSPPTKCATLLPYASLVM